MNSVGTITLQKGDWPVTRLSRNYIQYCLNRRCQQLEGADDYRNGSEYLGDPPPRALQTFFHSGNTLANTITLNGVLLNAIDKIHEYETSVLNRSLKDAKHHVDSGGVYSRGTSSTNTSVPKPNYTDFWSLQPIRSIT